ncbi:MAG: hypothetical protein NTX50_04680 [Candidatus Sumerlaeota bacterium]|nr:hypothetical protein [Candidatus Sumerlaeota bacterium]
MNNEPARKTDPIAAAEGILKGTALSTQRYFELKQQDKKLEARSKRKFGNDIAERGHQLLVEGLGVAGAARFIAQITGGLGDYTEERKAMFAHLTVDEIAREIEIMRREGKLPTPGRHGLPTVPAGKAGSRSKKKSM